LIEELGGRPTPGIGFGSGVERIVLALQHLGIQPPPLPFPKITVSYLGKVAKPVAINVVEKLHSQKIGAMLTPGDRSFKAQLKAANRANADFAIILGEDEVTSGQATVRNMVDSQQTLVELSSLVDWLKERL
jgi:histidyl-tRNA synthetase